MSLSVRWLLQEILLYLVTTNPAYCDYLSQGNMWGGGLIIILSFLFFSVSLTYPHFFSGVVNPFYSLFFYLSKALQFILFLTIIQFLQYSVAVINQIYCFFQKNVEIQ